jgi:hypothetical protein
LAWRLLLEDITTASIRLCRDEWIIEWESVRKQVALSHFSDADVTLIFATFNLIEKTATGVLNDEKRLT